MRRDHDGARSVLDGHIHALKAAHGKMKVVPFLFLRGDEQQQQIGAGGKIRGLVGDDHGVEFRAEALHSGLHHGGDVVADGVHLGVKFAAKHAVAEVDQAGAGIARDFLRAVLQRFEDDDAGRLRQLRVRARGEIERRKLTLGGFVERFFAAASRRVTSGGSGRFSCARR